jgi:YggT family protein
LAALAWAIPELIGLVINIFLFAILIQVILSWINPGGYNPLTGIIHGLTEPLLRPARRLIPPIGGLDLSPMVVMIGLVLLKMLLLPPLQLLMASPFR